MPAILRAEPVVEGNRLDGAMRGHLDIVPTLLRLGGFEGSAALPGVSLLEEGGSERPQVSQTAWWDGLSLRLLPVEERGFTYAIRTGRFKYVQESHTDLLRVNGPRSLLHVFRYLVGGRFKCNRLYDVMVDPSEVQTVAGERSGTAARLRASLVQMRKEAAREGCACLERAASLRNDARTREHLRQLGYE